MWLILSIAIALIVIGLLIAVIFVKRKEKSPPDYYVFFIMGLIWFPIGLATGNSPLWIMGVVFLTIGLANKNKWEKNRKKWSKMGPAERKLMIITMIVLAILLLAGFVMFLLVDKGVI